MTTAGDLLNEHAQQDAAESQIFHDLTKYVESLGVSRLDKVIERGHKGMWIKEKLEMMQEYMPDEFETLVEEMKEAWA